MKAIISVLAAALTLGACSKPGELRGPLTPASIAEAAQYDRNFMVPANAETTRLLGKNRRPTQWIAVDVTGYGAGIVTKGSGPGYPFQLEVNPRPRSNLGSRTEEVEVGVSAAMALAGNPDDLATARTLAYQVARATFCRGGQVVENRSLGTRYSDPRDLARIQVLGGRIPADARGQPVQAIERDRRGYWVFQLRCSLWQLN